jgi:acetyl-CoA carboxylase alpha subunit
VSALKDFLTETLQELTGTPTDQLLDDRYARYRKLGVFVENQAAETQETGDAGQS